MRKIQRINNLEAGPVNLDLPDLQEIVDTFKALPDSNRLKIVVGDYEISDLNEVSDIAPRVVSTLSLEYIDPLSATNCCLYIGESGVRIVYGEGDSLLQGISARIWELLSRTRRKWQWTAKLLPGFREMGKLSLLLLGLGFLMNLQSIVSIGLLTTCASLVGLFLYALTSEYRKSRISLACEDSHFSFWGRNRDTIAVAMITSFLSTVIGIFGTLVVQALVR
jgi:hypothetical protein